jgi:hypothetical protein
MNSQNEILFEPTKNASVVATAFGCVIFLSFRVKQSEVEESLTVLRCGRDQETVRDVSTSLDMTDVAAPLCRGVANAHGDRVPWLQLRAKRQHQPFGGAFPEGASLKFLQGIFFR